MCRAKAHGDRRCQNPEALARQNIIQQQLRYARKYVAAEEAGDHEAAQRNLAGLERAEARLEIFLESVDHTQRGASVASDYTVITTAHMSDFELAQRRRDLSGDPDAVDAITDVMNWRRAQEGDYEQTIEAELEALYAWGTKPSWEISVSPVETPSRTSRRKLSPEQQCREDYENYVHDQFLRAEDQCAGNLVTAAGRLKQIDPVDLFRGNTKMAEKYASPELKSWFRHHGRMTFAAFRHAYFDRDSDYQAAVHCRTTAAWDNAA